MLIVRIKSINTDREKREKIRKEIQEQTQQEVIVLPCECELVEVKTIFAEERMLEVKE